MGMVPELCVPMTSTVPESCPDLFLAESGVIKIAAVISFLLYEAVAPLPTGGSSYSLLLLAPELEPSLATPPQKSTQKEKEWN